jgi:hypothetical protein
VIGESRPLSAVGRAQDWRVGAPAEQCNINFANGFIEVYRDARGAKGTSQSFVSVTDQRVNAMMLKIADNAQYFEDHAPWDPKYRKQGVKPPMAKAVETVVETGGFHVTTVGDNLPNENEIHEKYGSKTIILARFVPIVRTFAPFVAGIGKMNYGRFLLFSVIGAAAWVTICVGAGYMLGSLDFFKKDFQLGKPAIVAISMIPSAVDLEPRRGYDQSVETTSSARCPRATIEGPRPGHHAIVNYIISKTGTIARVERDSKAYITVRDYGEMHQAACCWLS